MAKPRPGSFLCWRSCWQREISSQELLILSLITGPDSPSPCFCSQLHSTVTGLHFCRFSCWFPCDSRTKPAANHSSRLHNLNEHRLKGSLFKITRCKGSTLFYTSLFVVPLWDFGQKGLAVSLCPCSRLWFMFSCYSLANFLAVL